MCAGSRSNCLQNVCPMKEPAVFSRSTGRRLTRRRKETGRKRTVTERETREQADTACKKAYRSFSCRDAAVIPFCGPECQLFHRTDDGNRLGSSGSNATGQSACGNDGNR